MKKFFAGVLVVTGILLLWRGEKTPRMPKVPPAPKQTFSPTAKAPAPVRVPASAPVRKLSAKQIDEKTAMLKNIARLSQCYESRSCIFPETDPRSYEISIDRALSKELAKFHLKFRRDQGALGDLQFLAKKYIASGDGFVQEEALKMFSDLAPSEENVMALTEGLQSTPDADLMKQALPEFQRYIGTPWESKVHSFLSGSIATGAHFSSERISENILPFINPVSYPTYKQALKNMPPGAKAAANLEWALKEYRRHQTGA